MLPLTERSSQPAGCELSRCSCYRCGFHSEETEAWSDSPLVRLSGAVNSNPISRNSVLTTGPHCPPLWGPGGSWEVRVGGTTPSSHCGPVFLCPAPHRLTRALLACWMDGAAGHAVLRAAGRQRGGERATARPALLEPWPHSWPPGHWLHMTLEKWRHRAPAPRSQAERSAVREGAKDSQARQTSPSSLATTGPLGSASRPPPCLRPLLGASRLAWGTTQGPRQWPW